MKPSQVIARYKIYLDRSRTYVGYMQFLIMIKLLFSDMNITSNIFLVACVFVCMILLVVIGYLDTRFGIRAREMEDNTIENPVMAEMLEILRTYEKDKNIDHNGRA